MKLFGLLLIGIAILGLIRELRVVYKRIVEGAGDLLPSRQFGTTMSSKELRFPDGFMWGTATASYQIEGATTEDREPSIWDRFVNIEGKIHKGDTGDKACDHYHRFKEDVQLIKGLNTKYYRFSIAWPRIQKFPTTLDAPVLNEAGVRFYNQLIDELIANGITPVATLYHWDLPLSVEDPTGGWAGKGDVSAPFAAYARACFKAFGDRVKMWITLNEPWCSAAMGYEIGEHAPGNVSRRGHALYRAGHQLLLSHGKAVDVYRKEFQEKQGGKIGITLNSNWAEPYDPKDPASVAAARRDMEFELGWFAGPIWDGDYPKIMREAVGDRLPEFSEEEKRLLKGSSDFFGVNHYSSYYTVGMKPDESRKSQDGSYYLDIGTERKLDDSWGRTDMDWAIVPFGFRNLLQYIHERYHPTGGIIVTENGVAVAEPTQKDMEKNTSRVDFYEKYIGAMHEAISSGADVRGYFLWSLMDNFEWAKGYSKRFGLYYVDYDTMERLPKPAAKWYAALAGANALNSGV